MTLAVGRQSKISSDREGFFMHVGKQSDDRRLVLGVIFLTVSNLLTKICGMFLKVPLTNTLGDSGMAYFNLAYAVYKWFYMISTAGLPVAAAVLTAQYASNAIGDERCAILRRVRNVTLLAFLMLGLIGGLCMYFGAPLFAGLQKVPEGASSIAAIAPALFCICIASALRGWYQGLECQLPTAIAQVAEAVGKMVCGLWFAAYAIDRGYPISIVASWAAAGLSVGCLLGMAVMLISHPFVVRRFHITGDASNAAVPIGTLLSKLWKIALPVTLSASVMSLCDMLDSMIVIRRMCGAGIAAEEALRLYGNYTALAVPMFNLPPILIYPLTTALIPVISAARADQQRCQRIVLASLSTAVMIAMPCSAGMCLLSEPILRLFYRADLAAVGAPLLSALAPAVLFLSIFAMCNAILQAIGEARYALYAILLGAAVKLISDWCLTGTASISIMGSPISTVLCYVSMAGCALWFVVLKTGASLNMGVMLCRPAAAAVVCAVTARAAYRVFAAHLPLTAGTMLSILIGGITYLAALMALGGVNAEVLHLIFGRKRKVAS